MLRRSLRRQCQAHERFPETARIAPSYLASFALRRLFPYGLSVVSLPIGEALADDALHGQRGALYVVYAQRNAIGIAEVKLAQIPVQVLLFAVLVDALHTAFENRIETFNGVGADDVAFAFREAVHVGVARVFVRAVGHGIVACELLAQIVVVLALIGIDAGFLGDVGANDRHEVADRHPIDMEATRATAALNEGEHDVAVLRTASAEFLGRALDLAHQGFIDLDNFASAAHRLYADNPHSLADAMRHEPRGLEGDAQGPGKLVARNSLFGRAEQVHRLKPDVHRDMAVLEHGPNLHGELLAALVAFIEANPGRLALHFANAFDPAAVRANGAFRPYAGFNPRDSGGFILQNSGGQDRIGHNTDFPYVIQGYRGHMGLSSITSPEGEVLACFDPWWPDLNFAVA